MDLLPRPNSLCSTAFACSPGAGLALAATMMLGPGCAEPPVHDRPSPTGRIEQLAADLQQDNPWPEIREERIRLLLPQAMEAAGVDSWIVLCRENHNDPLAKHIGGEDAGPLAAFLFLHPPSGLERRVITAQRLVAPLKERFPEADILGTTSDESTWEMLAEQVRRAGPSTIAVDKSELAAADGLTATEYEKLQAALGPDLSSRLTSSEELVVRWLGVKLPAEHAIMRTATILTDLIELEAFKEVIPGTTTNGDLHRAIRDRVESLGLGHSWPDQPGILTGLDGGTGKVLSKVIQPGDLINIDAGIKAYDIWCTDVQRFAYVLREGETAPPEHIRHAWDSARESSRKMAAAMRPGVRGWEVEKVQIDWQEQQGSLRHWAGTGHPVGYWAHDLGPGISGYYMDRPPSARGRRRLETGMVFAYDGNYVWPATYAGIDGTISITIEEMALVTEEGGEYLSPPQEELVLIPAR